MAATLHTTHHQPPASTKPAAAGACTAPERDQPSARRAPTVKATERRDIQATGRQATAHSDARGLERCLGPLRGLRLNLERRIPYCHRSVVPSARRPDLETTCQAATPSLIAVGQSGPVAAVRICEERALADPSPFFRVVASSDRLFRTTVSDWYAAGARSTLSQSPPGGRGSRRRRVTLGRLGLSKQLVPRASHHHARTAHRRHGRPPGRGGQATAAR